MDTELKNSEIEDRKKLLSKKLDHQYERDYGLEVGLSRTLFSIFLLYYKGFKHLKSSKKGSMVDPEWELIDPAPNIYALFRIFNANYFWGTLDSVEVKWSNRMYRCSGLCVYKGPGGCSIHLSFPLLRFRPRRDMVETLLHEMIHAFLFVTNNVSDRTNHGPEFHKHMRRINNQCGTNITVYHNFLEEIQFYKNHWWRCDGPCQREPPYFGIVKRVANRPPGPSDSWFLSHNKRCNGNFIKIKEPEIFDGKKKRKRSEKPRPKKESENSSSQKKSKSILNDPQASSKPDSDEPVDDSLNLKKGTKGNKGLKSIKSSYVIKSKVKSFSDLENENETTKDTKSRTSFVPFSGAGHVLGSKAPKMLPNGQTVISSRSLLDFLSSVQAKKSLQDRTVQPEIHNVESGGAIRKTLKDMPSGSSKPIDDSGDSCISLLDNLGRQSNVLVNCPVCSKKVNVDEINEHLDICIPCDVSNETITISDSEEEDEEHLVCPCCIYVCSNLADMNTHLTNCLSTL